MLTTAEKALLTGEREAVQETAGAFGLNASRLSLHIEMLRDICARRGSKVTNSRDLMQLLLADLSLLELLPEVSQLVRLLLTVPATSCASERSFSLLRRLKSYLRATTSQARLNHAAVCATYGDELSELNLADIIAEFARRSPQRVRLFGVSSSEVAAYGGGGGGYGGLRDGITHRAGGCFDNRCGGFDDRRGGGYSGRDDGCRGGGDGQRGDFDDRSGRDGPWDGGRRGGGGGGPPHMEFREPDPSDAARRLKLSLKTRSVAVPTNTVANSSQTSSILVGAEPR